MSDAGSAMTETDAWGRLGTYLARDALQLLAPNDRDPLLSTWQEITRQEEQLDDALLIGLLGGTGVGKSTLINALSREWVSRSSDRRPTTDRIVVYRHAATELPEELPLADLAQPQITHRHQRLEKVVLLDFPDFDSAEADHAEKVFRYLPFLDVLLVLADDVKYGDRRLYELLNQLRQAQTNLFLVFNKIDRLEARYGDTTPRIVHELTEDFRAKARQFAGMELPADHVLPISAARAWQCRAETARDRSAAAGDVETPTRSPTAAPSTGPGNIPRRYDGMTSLPLTEASLGDGVERLESLLDGYQRAKHRRRVKEQNIDAKKLRLVQDVRRLALTDENRSILQETRQLVEAWRREAESCLCVIPRKFVSQRERRALRRSRLRTAAPQFGLPFSLLFTLLAELAGRRGGFHTLDGQNLAARILHHYRGYFEALRNLETRFRAEFAGARIAAANRPASAIPVPSPALQGENWAAAAAARLQDPLLAAEREPPRRGTRLYHLPAVLVLALMVWSLIYPVFGALLGQSDQNAVAALIKALWSAVSPFYLTGAMAVVLLAYLFTAAILATRELQRMDQQIAELEQEVRAQVLRQGEKLLDRFDRNVHAFGSELRELESLLPAPPHD